MLILSLERSTFCTIPASWSWLRSQNEGLTIEAAWLFNKLAKEEIEEEEEDVEEEEELEGFSVVCKLAPQSSQINIQDTHEIDDAKWVSPEDFLTDKGNSIFNKYLVKSLLNATGLGKSSLDLSQFSKLKHEVFLAGN